MYFITYIHLSLYIYIYIFVIAYLLSYILPICDVIDCSHDVSLSMGFPRQEYWSELPFPSPGDLLDPGIEHTSSALAGGFFTIELPGKSIKLNCVLPNL